MINVTWSVLLVAVMAIVTMALRFMPFIVFNKKTPKIILYLGEVLPYAITGMLVVYCLKGINLMTGLHGLPELGCVLLVIVLHKWKHNTLLSIIVGTICYMLAIQML